MLINQGSSLEEGIMIMPRHQILGRDAVVIRQDAIQFTLQSNKRFVGQSIKLRKETIQLLDALFASNNREGVEIVKAESSGGLVA